LVEPCYIGFWSALNFHGFTEQTPSTVFIATVNTMRNRKILGTKYIFVKIKPKKLFGFKKYFIANKPVNISDKEKTIVDCFDRPDLCGGISEAVKPFLTGENIDYKKIVLYAERIGGACLKRVGFVLEKLKLADTSKLLKKVNTGYVYVDTLAPKKGSHNSKWNIIENIDLEKLKKEVLT
jgi:predicted transcriptional regulator of viral defense system